jgi:hypothetical protein
MIPTPKMQKITKGLRRRRRQDLDGFDEIDEEALRI